MVTRSEEASPGAAIALSLGDKEGSKEGPRLFLSAGASRRSKI